MFWRRRVEWRPRFYSTAPSCWIITTDLSGNSLINSASYSRIHPYYQYIMDETTRSWSKRERHTHTTNTETRIERKRERKRKKPEESACYTRVSQQTLDLIHCQSKLNRISHASAQGAEIHHSRVGEREGDRVGEGWGRAWGWYGRLHEPISPLSLLNSNQLWQLFSRVWTILLSIVIYDLDPGITAKYSKRHTSFYLMQVSFRFHLLRCSEILVSSSICTKIRTRRFRIFFA